MADGNIVSEAVATALYRHFDKDGALLYVGISLSPTYRLSQHRDASRWFSRIADIKIEWHDSREAALEAERAAIKAETPEFNIVHNRNIPEVAGIIERIADESRADLNRRLVRYNPIYKVTDAATAIGLSATKLRLAVNAGDLPAIYDGSKMFITGWALIAYLEALEAGIVSIRKAPAHNPYGPLGKPLTGNDPSGFSGPPKPSNAT